MSGPRNPIAAFLIFNLVLIANAEGGKLGNIRSKANGSVSTSKKARSAKSRDSSASETHTDQPTTPPKRKTESIRLAVRSPRVANPSHTRLQKNRPRRSPRHHQPASSFGFYSHYAPAVCGPTVVEEHHYFGAPVPVSSDAYAPAIALSTEPIFEEPEIATLEERVDFSLAPFHLRFELDHASDEADLTRTGFGLLLNATGGLGIDTGIRLFRENDAEFRDHMWIGDFNIVYEIFPTSFSRTRAGIGLNWLSDPFGREAGVNLTVGTDLFAGPLTFSAEVDLGTLGDTDLSHGRLTASIRPGDFVEWFAGYDYLNIGGTEIRGIVGGLRFRL